MALAGSGVECLFPFIEKFESIKGTQKKKKKKLEA